MIRSPIIRKQTIDRDQSCQRCKIVEDLICHHIEALIEGGSDTLDNTITLCGTCHHGWHHSCEGWIDFDVYLSRARKRIDLSHSEKTKAGLRAAKERGTKLGGDRGHMADIAHDGARISAENRSKAADDRARKMLPFIEEARAAGITSLNGIAKHLNDNGLRTARMNNWTHVTVKQMLDRLTPR